MQEPWHTVTVAVEEEEAAERATMIGKAEVTFSPDGSVRFVIHYKKDQDGQVTQRNVFVAVQRALNAPQRIKMQAHLFRRSTPAGPLRQRCELADWQLDGMFVWQVELQPLQFEDVHLGCLSHLETASLRKEHPGSSELRVAITGQPIERVIQDDYCYLHLHDSCVSGGGPPIYLAGEYETLPYISKNWSSPEEHDLNQARKMERARVNRKAVLSVVAVAALRANNAYEVFNSAMNPDARVRAEELLENLGAMKGWSPVVTQQLAANGCEVYVGLVVSQNAHGAYAALTVAQTGRHGYKTLIKGAKKAKAACQAEVNREQVYVSFQPMQGKKLDYGSLFYMLVKTPQLPGPLTSSAKQAATKNMTLDELKRYADERDDQEIRDSLPIASQGIDMVLLSAQTGAIIGPQKSKRQTRSDLFLVTHNMPTAITESLDWQELVRQYPEACFRLEDASEFHTCEMETHVEGEFVQMTHPYDADEATWRQYFCPLPTDRQPGVPGLPGQE